MKKQVKWGAASLALAAMTLIGCSKSNEYVINGKLPANYDGATIQMIDVANPDNRVEILPNDSAFTFTYSGVIEGDSVRRLKIGRGYIDFVLEPGTINIDCDKFTATGTPLNDRLNDFNMEVQGLQQQIESKFAALGDDAQEQDYEAIINEYANDAMALIKKTVAENPNNSLGTIAMSNIEPMMPLLNLEDVKAVYAMAGEYPLGYEPVARLNKTIEAIERTQPGQKFVDFNIATGNADGSAVSLSDYVGKGKYVLVDFWASWCGPCRAETPNVRAAYDKYHGKGLEVLGVTVQDQRDATKRAMDELGIVWPQIYDASFDQVALYGSNGIPFIVLFDPEGNIVARNLRGNAIDETLSQHLGK